jgi:hypothetical protein
MPSFTDLELRIDSVVAVVVLLLPLALDTEKGGKKILITTCAS